MVFNLNMKIILTIIINTEVSKGAKMKNLIGILSLVLIVSCGNSIALTENELQIVKEIQFDEKITGDIKNSIGTGFEKSNFSISMYDESGNFLEEKIFDKGITFEISQDDFDSLIQKYYFNYKDLGYLIFRSEMNFNIEDKKDQLTVIKSTDDLDIIKLMQTDGINYDIDNQNVIEKLTAWKTNHPFYIVGAGLDWMEARFYKPLGNIDDFANDIYEFCPDIVDQGTSSVEALIKEMKRLNTLYLWWD